MRCLMLFLMRCLMLFSNHSIVSSFAITKRIFELVLWWLRIGWEERIRRRSACFWISYYDVFVIFRAGNDGIRIVIVLDKLGYYERLRSCFRNSLFSWGILRYDYDPMLRSYFRNSYFRNFPSDTTFVIALFLGYYDPIYVIALFLWYYDPIFVIALFLWYYDPIFVISLFLGYYDSIFRNFGSDTIFLVSTDRYPDGMLRSIFVISFLSLRHDFRSFSWFNRSRWYFPRVFSI